MSDEDDYVLSKNGGKITSFGYEIDSDLLKNTLQKGGGLGIPNIFDNLAIPAGFANTYKKQSGGSKKTIEVSNDDVIDRDIYDRLLDMVTVGDDKSEKRKTKRGDMISSSSSNKKTRKTRTTK
jgi:hypothetical protein